MSRWAEKIQALRRLAEDQRGKPEGELAAAKADEILRNHPEVRVELAQPGNLRGVAPSQVVYDEAVWRWARQNIDEWFRYHQRRNTGWDVERQRQRDVRSRREAAARKRRLERMERMREQERRQFVMDFMQELNKRQPK